MRDVRAVASRLPRLRARVWAPVSLLAVAGLGFWLVASLRAPVRTWRAFKAAVEERDISAQYRLLDWRGELNLEPAPTEEGFRWFLEAAKEEGVCLGSRECHLSVGAPYVIATLPTGDGGTKVLDPAGTQWALPDGRVVRIRGKPLKGVWWHEVHVRHPAGQGIISVLVGRTSAGWRVSPGAYFSWHDAQESRSERLSALWRQAVERFGMNPEYSKRKGGGRPVWL